MLPEEERSLWLASHILPHEGAVRQWLRRFSGIDPDDIIQEAFVVLSEARISAIASPRAYFFSVARNIVMDHYRRARLVAIDDLTEVSAGLIYDDAPSIECIATARQELRVLDEIIKELPERCRQTFISHRIYGYSQGETAARLGLSLNVVEKAIAKAMMLIGRAYARRDIGMRSGHERARPHSRRKNS